MPLPLAEKNVVVTRPKEQADELKLELERLGARVILFPTIEIVAPDSYADLDTAIKNLSEYDWLVLMSANATEHFLQRLQASNVETFELDHLRLCAIGEATAERLRQAQIHIDLIPTDSRAENVFTALSEYLGGEAALENLRFLLPRSSIGRDYLPIKLRGVNAIVDAPIAYQTVLPRNAETGKLKALLQGGAIDCITFTSPSTFKNFVNLLSDFDLAKIFKSVVIACLGKTTAQTVYEYGFQANVIATDANAKAFAKSIATYLEHE
jgi:uroporphyrinogen III methyltransferase/synthase